MKPYPAFVWSMTAIKHAAAEVNRDLGLLDPMIADAIIQAADAAMSIIDLNDARQSAPEARSYL